MEVPTIYIFFFVAKKKKKICYCSFLVVNHILEPVRLNFKKVLLSAQREF